MGDKDNSERVRYRNAFGAALSAQLQARGLSQAELARRLGTQRSYVTQIMTGIKGVSPQYADTIANTMTASPQERSSLHLGAAVSAGYRLDLPQNKNAPDQVGVPPPQPQLAVEAPLADQVDRQLHRRSKPRRKRIARPAAKLE